MDRTLPKPNELASNSGGRLIASSRMREIWSIQIARGAVNCKCTNVPSYARQIALACSDQDRVGRVLLAGSGCEGHIYKARSGSVSRMILELRWRARAISPQPGQGAAEVIDA